MYKNATYKQKFADLHQWVPLIIDSVKKDLKNEHLKKDFLFVKKFLSNKNINKVTVEELAQAYQKAINEEEKGEEIAEFIASRWLLKNSELYEFFERQLTQINPDFASLETLEPAQAKALIDAANREFSPADTYLFAVLNSVVFPDESFKSLRTEAEKHKHQQEKEIEETTAEQTLESFREAYQREIQRLTDKYEKKFLGLQKKYLQDTEGLKKQIAQLQRKLQGKGA